MKTLIATLAILTASITPAFADTYISTKNDAVLGSGPDLVTQTVNLGVTLSDSKSFADISIGSGLTLTGDKQAVVTAEIDAGHYITNRLVLLANVKPVYLTETDDVYC